MHWADKYAEQIIRKKQKEKYVVESGISPSGIVHAGNFREIMTQDLVYRALIEKGVNAVHQFVFDDYDRFRKVPKGIPEKYSEYLGMPLSSVPDPWGCHPSYAEHYEEALMQELEKMGVITSVVRMTEEYKACRYSENVRAALEKRKQIIEILNKYRSEPHPENWMPTVIYCAKCGKEVHDQEYLGEFTIKYECKCGYSEEFDFRKKGIVKLKWRVDWPMRWAYYDVDFESSGKDHQAAGGSWDTGKRIAREVFGQDPPLGPMYEFIYLKGVKEKMSSSKGNVVSVSELLKYFEPSVLRYLYTMKINKALEVPLDQDILNAYNYFDEAENAFFSGEGDDNEKRRYSLAVIGRPKEKPIRVPFSVCVNMIQITLGDTDKAINILEGRTGHLKNASEEDKKRARERLGKAWAWVNELAPEQFRFQVLEKMPSVSVPEKEAKVLEKIAGMVEKGVDGTLIQEKIREYSEEEGASVREVFRNAYMLLLGRDRGPRLGPFLASLDPAFASARLKRKA